MKTTLNEIRAQRPCGKEWKIALETFGPNRHREFEVSEILSKRDHINGYYNLDWFMSNCVPVKKQAEIVIDLSYIIIKRSQLGVEWIDKGLAILKDIRENLKNNEIEKFKFNDALLQTDAVNYDSFFKRLRNRIREEDRDLYEDLGGWFLTRTIFKRWNGNDITCLALKKEIFRNLISEATIAVINAHK